MKRPKGKAPAAPRLPLLPVRLKIAVAAMLVVLLLAGGEKLLSGRVLSVADGDSLTIYTSLGQKERVRLYGVDSPELGQEGGREAKEFCRSLALYKQVDIRVLYTDQYGRKVALISLSGGKVLNEELVRNGHAWVYTQFCKTGECRDWKRLEKTAKETGLGLWNNAGAQPPWQWRKGNARR